MVFGCEDQNKGHNFLEYEIVEIEDFRKLHCLPLLPATTLYTPLMYQLEQKLITKLSLDVKTKSKSTKI